MMKKNEKKFYSALKDVFVGAKVEGESGYINLMRIKSRYFEEGVFPKLQKDIDNALKPFEDFREELFDKLYTFFNRYFSESGSIYFRYTPLHQNVYEKVYTDDKDVMLFYKTHMLYYVKTDRLFKSLEVKLDGLIFFFDVSTLEHKKANEKREITYEFKQKRKDGSLAFNVAYSEKGRKTKVDAILKEFKKQGLKVNEEVLEQAFRVFERQSEVDYFINKNAKAFLQEQFNLWFYQYVFSGESAWTERRIKQLQTLKDIAFKIIDFISQFEDELVKIWNKPKFVLDSNYVITLDKIASPVLAGSQGQGKQSPETKKRHSDRREEPLRLIEKFLDHSNFKAQVEEWKQLGIVDGDFKKNEVILNDLAGKRLSEKYRYLPIDTKYFKDLELEILGLFSNLDEALDGWLIKSENYQALNTLLPKFGNRVKAVYIDPPYNTSASEILYENKYKDSSWLTLIENRLSITKNFLKDDGLMCVTIDDEEASNLMQILKPLYEVLGVIAIRNNPAGRSTARGFSIAHEYGIFACKTERASIGRLERSEKQIARYDEADEDGNFEWVNFRKHGATREESPKMFFPFYVTEKTLRIPQMEWDDAKREWIVKELPKKGEVSVYPIDENGKDRRWKWGYERCAKHINKLKIGRDRNNALAIYTKSRLNPEGMLPLTWWDKKEYSATAYGTNLLKNLFGELQTFLYPKSVFAVADCLRVLNLKSTDIALDYFAGSGTTAHSTIMMNREDGGKRKYLLVEMAYYVDSVILPRIKKVIFCEKWKDGKPADGNGISHFIKYYSLEQYEDTLRKVKYDDSDLFENPYQDPYNQYVFLRDLKMLEALKVDLKQNKVAVDLSKLYDRIDIPETLSNLTGKWIKRVTADSVEFMDGETVDLKTLDYRMIKPLIWW